MRRHIHGSDTIPIYSSSAPPEKRKEGSSASKSVSFGWTLTPMALWCLLKQKRTVKSIVTNVAGEIATIEQCRTTVAE